MCRYCGRDLQAGTVPISIPANREVKKQSGCLASTFKLVLIFMFFPFWLLWWLWKQGSWGRVTAIGIILVSLIVNANQKNNPQRIELTPSASPFKAQVAQVQSQNGQTQIQSAKIVTTSNKVLVLEPTNTSTQTPIPVSTATPTVTPTPTMNPEEYKALATTPGIRDLTRNTENYEEKIVTYYGRVLQVIESQAWLSSKVTYTIRLAVNDNFDDVIVAKLEYEDGKGFRPLEKDLITIWGAVGGRESFTTVLGAQVTLPVVNVKYIASKE